MRDELNAILDFIGCESLTDQEFDSLTLTGTGDLAAVYNALLAVLDARESVSEARDRLRYYFLAQGVELEESSSGKSNILIGVGLW